MRISHFGLIIIVVAALPSIVSSTAIWPPCGWPYLEQNFVRPSHFQTRLVQRLLNMTNASGIFDDATTSALKAFQSANGLPADGDIGSQTWPVLTGTASSISFGASSLSSVTGAQEMLSEAYGFSVNITGNFDPQTVTALAAFSQSRGADDVSGKTLGPQQWHLLATNCNSSAGNASFFVDIGWPQGTLSVETLTCMKGYFGFVTFECWLQRSAWFPTCVQNIKNAHAAGFSNKEVGVYMFPVRDLDPTLQAEWLVANLSAAGAVYNTVMIDIEGSDYENYTQAENRVFITSLRSGLESAGQKVVIYSGLQWISYFGKDFTSFSDLPVIYAHYDLVPSFYDFLDSPYGGWTRPAGKQFWDGQSGEVVCGNTPIDWDWSDRKWWLD
jgi:peptidoglycan hydrolase-like protein with peptidoglycan-binding domain